MASKPIKIEPISFRSGPPSPSQKPFDILKWLAGVFLGVVLVLLGGSAWFVFTARQVVITIAPDPDALTFSGFMPKPRMGDHYLMRPGAYTLTAVKECFFPLEHTFQVSGEKRQNLHLKMKKLPGRLTIRAHQSGMIQNKIADAQVYIDGQKVGKTPLDHFEIQPGEAKLEIRASNYQDLNTDIQVHGCGKFQELDLAMLPRWSDVTVSSVPPGAALKIDGKSLGNTPSRIQLAAGTYLMEISADLYKTWTHRLVVKPNESLEIKDVRLQPADGKLAIKTTPPGANVMIGETFMGQTPLVMDLSPDTDHVVRISRAGYEKATRTVKVASAMSTQLHVNLKPRKGIINLWLKPADTDLLVNGKSWGIAPKQLRLIAVEHNLEFRKKGYRSYRTRITPRPGFPQELRITLVKESASQKAASSIITTPTGYRLKLIRPKTYTMGSSRREQGRRSNETLRKVELTRPFYMGLQEVTNKLFKEFMSGHHSGTFKSENLDRDDQPVVRITWEQAALFCNWLSAKESLSPAYVKKGEQLMAVEPLNTGYRLPTEAEWEYCARFAHTQTFLKYPWGHQFPPKELSGNYSDQSAKDLLPNVLEGYNDQYASTAPPAKFKPNGLGLYDMGGNVAEWCHDYYSIYSYAPEKIYVDPAGPVTGKHHVIRGSSWKHGSIGTLRLAYRSYGDASREDVGFRVCRYLK